MTWMGLLALPLVWGVLSFLQTEKRDSLPEDQVVSEEEEKPWGAKPRTDADPRRGAGSRSPNG